MVYISVKLAFQDVDVVCFVIGNIIVHAMHCG